MKSSLLLLLILAYQFRRVYAFAPVRMVHPETTIMSTSTTRLEYNKNRTDEIAQELIDLVPGNHKVSHTKDHSMWKRLMEMEHYHDQNRELQKELKKIKHNNATRIRRLEEVLIALWHLTRELNYEHFQLMEELALMDDENQSFRSLWGKMIRLMGKWIRQLGWRLLHPWD